MVSFKYIHKCCINNQKYNDKTDKLYYYKGYYGNTLLHPPRGV